MASSVGTEGTLISPGWLDRLASLVSHTSAEEAAVDAARQSRNFNSSSSKTPSPHKNPSKKKKKSKDKMRERSKDKEAKRKEKKKKAFKRKEKLELQGRLMLRKLTQVPLHYIPFTLVYFIYNRNNAIFLSYQEENIYLATLTKTYSFHIFSVIA